MLAYLLLIEYLDTITDSEDLFLYDIWLVFLIDDLPEQIDEGSGQLHCRLGGGEFGRFHQFRQAACRRLPDFFRGLQFYQRDDYFQRRFYYLIKF